jgi:hypothetical protein
MAAGGGLSASAWIPAGEASSFNVGVRAAANQTWENFGEASQTSEATFEVEANLGLSKGDAYYYLRSVYNGPFAYDSGDYYSFYLGLGFSSQLPRLLAP